ncbi:hypothetical protein [Leptolyngbya sp. FACHB-261]|uniref:hypothetical protein n=1 Tax=Leptolyngbya sp. FACHB-261 TaxID=2692806 RepID=UPI0016844239|nr:hypothetical protein [Leptolyngbya sp. FACHB-261]MBD2104923.1 hypothetical protein [Leptolyngbya sp. FACHB-261]
MRLGHLGWLLLLLWSPPALAGESCPADLPGLAQGLVRDLPSYANRAYARYNLRTHLVVAGRPEFDPLPTGPGQLNRDLGQTAGTAVPNRDDDVKQLFFSTLERAYTPEGTQTVEQFHWLFLAQDAETWRLALLFTRTGARTGNPPLLTPPRDNSNGALAEAIRTWLRDCQAGYLRRTPLRSTPPQSIQQPQP